MEGRRAGWKGHGTSGGRLPADSLTSCINTSLPHSTAKLPTLCRRDTRCSCGLPVGCSTGLDGTGRDWTRCHGRGQGARMCLHAGEQAAWGQVVASMQGGRYVPLGQSRTDAGRAASGHLCVATPATVPYRSAAGAGERRAGGLGDPVVVEAIDSSLGRIRRALSGLGGLAIGLWLSRQMRRWPLAWFAVR